VKNIEAFAIFYCIYFDQPSQGIEIRADSHNFSISLSVSMPPARNAPPVVRATRPIADGNRDDSPKKTLP
jgi:hypothetical protein